MSSNLSWWIWIFFVLAFLFNVFRRLKGQPDPSDQVLGRGPERAKREEGMSDLLDTLREAAKEKAAGRPPVATKRAPRPPPPPAAPAHLPQPPAAPAGRSGFLRPAEEHHFDESSLAFSNDPLIQGIVLSEILSPPLALRGKELH